MRKNLHTCWAGLLQLALLLSVSGPALYAQDGTQNDGFSVQLLLPNGQRPVHALGNGGYGYAAFGADVVGELELDIVWARTAGGDSLACTPAVNANELAGKAALIRRGDCNFQLKAANAEAGGAASVIIVNNAAPTSGDELAVTNMISTAGVGDVNIPCIFVCRAVGNQITAALDAGLPVKIRYVFPHLGEGVAAYHFATPVSQIQTLSAIGVNVYNRTDSAENGIVVKADIIEPNGNIVSLAQNAPGIGPGIYSFLDFPDYTPPALKGRYDVVFSMNKYRETYDTVRTSFLITERTFATDDYQLLPSGAGPGDADFASAGYYYATGGLCITGSQGAVVTHASFGIANAAEIAVPGNPSANPVYVFLLDADFDGDGQVDDFVDFLDLNLLSFGSYEIQGTEAPNALIHVPLYDLFTNQPAIPLLPDHLYYIALAYNGTDALTAKSIRFSASGKVDYLAFPTTPIVLNQVYAGGWSDATVVQRLQLEGFSPDDPYPATPPVAAFEPVANNLSVSFTNNSTNATTYSWDFGDGAVSTEANPVHDYAADGIYVVKLIATNAEGSHAAVRTIQLGMAPPVGADFSAAETAGCTPFVTRFTAATQGPGLSYSWSFPGGNPSFSTDPNPEVSYSFPGNHTVSLLVSNGVSTATEEKPAYITALTVPFAIFSAADPVGKTVAFENLSYYATAYAWDFGDGETSAAFQPSHTYAADGEYTVRLIASNICGADTGQLTVTITSPPVAGFSAGATIGCTPFTVQFTNTSSGNATGYFWSFPGGTPATSTAQHPTVVYSNPGVFDVSLAVTAPGGVDSAVQHGLITVGAPPTAIFLTSKTDLTLTFFNNSTGATAYLWDFGDGNSSTEAEPVHAYAAEGIYTITLTATNDCGVAIYALTRTVATPPKANFTAVSIDFCAPATVQFMDKSSSNVTGWSWSFPGGSPSSSSEQNPVVEYDMAGTYHVSLVVSGLGGTDSTALTNPIKLNGLPTAQFYGGSLDGLTAYFFNQSQNATSYLWDFGDGTTSTETEPEHTYAAEGWYKVTLTAINDCGQVQFVLDIPVFVGTKAPRLDERQVRVSPNPAVEQFRVEVALNAVSDQVTVALLDLLGRQLLVQHQDALRQGVFWVPVAQLPSGLYQLWVVTDEGVALRNVQVYRP